MGSFFCLLNQKIDKLSPELGTVRGWRCSRKSAKERRLLGGIWSHFNRLMNFIISEPRDSGTGSKHPSSSDSKYQNLAGAAILKPLCRIVSIPQPGRGILTLKPKASHDSMLVHDFLDTLRHRCFFTLKTLHNFQGFWSCIT